MWDHYFHKPEGYAPGTEEIALVKIDRDLRLADAMQFDPPWLKWLAGADEPVTARGDALEVLMKLAADKAITPQGLEAFAILKATQDRRPMRETLGQMLQGQMISDFRETSEQLNTHRGTWWQAKLIDSWEESDPPVNHWRDAYGQDTLQLRMRAVAARSAVWLLGIVGLAFIPTTLKFLKNGLFAQPRGYAGAWPISLGLVISLVAILAWIGFTMTLEMGIEAVPGMHPAMGIFLDSAARLLPSLIALGLIFRRPSHAVRVMGLNRPLELKAILGMFSLLMIIDQIIQFLLGTTDLNSPGGGLSSNDAGYWGLAFAVVSACLLAPVAEEILYRGVLFRSCRNRIGVIPAALVSSAVFAGLHFYDGYGLVSVGVFGFSCALLYSGTGSLTTVITLHLLYNTSIKIPDWIFYHAPLG